MITTIVLTAVGVLRRSRIGDEPSQVAKVSAQQSGSVRNPGRVYAPAASAVALPAAAPAFTC
ncbi:hypothetical protein [Nocardia jiangsuensis]|uniref:Uncharacterized protein n=1 Tax=Nocardia jiangsuensis TaxID=1691563 RepID=A0ABV8DMF2_9NOCA